MATYYLPYYDETGKDNMYIKKDVILSGTATSEALAESFTTGASKLALQQDGTAFPSFDAFPQIVITPKQDGDIRVTRGSETLNGNGTITFSLYLSSDSIDQTTIYFDIGFSAV